MVGTLTGDFRDSVVVVTGSTHGIGKCISRRFGKTGATVVVSGRSKQEGENVVKSIQENGGRAKFVQTDLRNIDDIVELIEKTVIEYGKIDVLINNAAIQTETSVTDATLKDWNRIIETNFRAYWLTVKEAIEYMPGGSVVINISSNHAHHTMPSHFPYNAVKAGIEGLTRAMAIDLCNLNIRANAVTPGWIRVDRTENEIDAEYLHHLQNIHPVGRIGEPDDIAGTCIWLASQDAAFVTGTSILVDGGRGAVMQDDRLSKYKLE